MGQSSNDHYIVLAGNPNSGKSTWFNLLTGLNQHVGNYPGVTVDKKVGTVRLPAGRTARVLDLPGSYSLYPTGKDERVAVRHFLSEKKHPDLIIYVADVSQLEKQALMLTQLIDFGFPLVLALNMVDLEGIHIDTDKLSRHFGVPVIGVSGKTGKGLSELKGFIDNALEGKLSAPKPYYSFSPVEQELVDRLANQIDFPSTYGKLLTLHHAAWLPHLPAKLREAIIKETSGSNFNSIRHQIEETMTRYDRFTPVIREAVRITEGGAGMKMTDRIDRWVMHPVLGSVIFFMIMLLVFQAIFAWATAPMDFIESSVTGLANWLSGVLPAGWLNDLICDGLLAGLAGVLVFIPQIAILFLLIGLLEEIGYMARAVSMFDMLMRKFGLNGRSIVALVSGGACAIPAIMTTRNISNWKERLITIMVTPFISCSARIPVYAILIGFAVPRGRIMGFEQQGIALMGLYGLGVTAALGAAWILKKIVRTSDRSFLMMELPVYRPPVAKNLLLLVYEKTKAFVFGAGKIILMISMVLWFLSSFGPSKRNTVQPDQEVSESLERIPIDESYAGLLGKAIEPAIAPLGFDWKIGIALLTSFAAREVFVGTMATIYSIEDDSDMKSIRVQMAEDRHHLTGKPLYSPATAWSLLIFYVFAMQCMSTLAVVKRETKSWKWPLIQLLMMTTLAYCSSLIVFQLLS